MRAFVQTADAVAATTKKLEKIRLVAELLKTLSANDASRAAVFFTGRAFPRREERVLGIGGSTLYRLVAEIAGKSADELSAIYRQHGDLGDVAEEALRSRSLPHDLALSDLARAFDQLSAARTQAQKYELLRALAGKASPSELKYVIKIITGDLRIGLKESLVEEAIAKAFDRPAAAVRRANMLIGDIGETLRLAASDKLGSASVALLHPIGFMLAAVVESAEGLFEPASEAPPQYFVEEKYDGIRAQVHKSGRHVKIFSRTLDEVAEFPELRQPVLQLPGDFILDGEILAWQGGRPLPFTELQKRLGRKQNQMSLWMRQQVPVRFVAFDLIYLNNQLLLDTPLQERRALLTSLFSAPYNEALQLAPAQICDSPEAVTSAFRQSLAAGHEGIVAKDPQSPYTPGRRGGYWFKLKQPYATLDVVITAVEYGHGKRHGLLSDYTFAVRKGEQLLNIGKAYSGLTDKEIGEYTKFFLEHTTEDQAFRRLVEPIVVIEVAFNNIQKSARHESGYALRFPRIVRFRPDKLVAEIDTLDRLADLYEKQFAKNITAGSARALDDL